jgi:hypothetical protein
MGRSDAAPDGAVETIETLGLGDAEDGIFGSGPTPITTGSIPDPVNPQSDAA